MMRNFCIVAALGAAVAPLSLAQTLTHGDATFSLIPNPPFSSSLPDTNFKTDPTSGDYMSKYSWSYRTQFNNQNSLMSKLDNPVVFTSGNLCRMTWTNAGPAPAGQERFNAELTITLVDGANPKQARLFSVMKFQSAANSPVVYQIFNLNDIDMPGGTPNPQTDDSVLFISPGEAVFSEQASFENAIAVTNTNSAHEANNGFTLRNKTSSGSFDLTNVDGPVTGDGSSAFQWTAPLGPGEEFTICSGIAINQDSYPQNPCIADVNFDHVVDDLDFQTFVIAYNDLLCPGSGPSRPFCLSDLNDDNVVDDLDFQVFVLQYNTLVCP
ncbi:MAG: hypothetical protein K2Y21_00840 [Phycisphaerales bacterium]|nr:hypothetical protein [Phycisphaerales bacterium]